VRRALPALGFGIVLALVCDQAIRLLYSPPANESRHWSAQTVQYHPVLGWSGYPNFVATKDGIRIQTNSLGYRDREPPDVEDPRKPGVLFLGDSFTWGDEVAAEDRFTDLLEASCGSLCDRLPRIRAINKGTIGYGTAQSLLDYLLARGERPFDVVILALYSGNDLTDNAAIDSPTGPRPRLIRCDGERPRGERGQDLCLEGVPVPPVVDWPEHRLIDPRHTTARTFGWSGLFAFAAQRRAPKFVLEKRIADQMADMAKALPFPIVERTSEAPIEDRVGQLEAILRAFKRTVSEGGKSFGVMVFPSARVYAGDPEGELQEYREIVAVLDRLDIPFVDYYEQTKNLQSKDLYSGDQGHWRVSGHQQAATLLRSLLVTLVPRRTSAKR
jgi:lysophospholipase L1-like esterase